MKALLAVASILGALSPAASPPQPAPYDAVHKVRCGNAGGTAFQIASGRLITAAHVTQFGPCSIDGRPVATIHEDKRLDIAELAGDAGPATLRIDCSRPKAGERFRAIGYAGGEYRMDSNLTATGERLSGHPNWGGAGIYVGGSIPGMSGGPIGRGQEFGVSAIVNAASKEHHLVAGNALADTYLCGSRK